MNATTPTFDRPASWDIEAVRPHLRKHLQPFKFLIAGSEVTVHGSNHADAKKRFKAMTGGEVAFIPATRGGIRKGEVKLVMAGRSCGKSTYMRKPEPQGSL